MYFDASERIALDSSFPRVEIERIDDFLAGERVKQFELHQLQDIADVRNNAEAILEYYIRQRIVDKHVFYQCPVDEIALENLNRREGKCPQCEQIYAFEDCESVWVYERKREPDRKKATDQKISTIAVTEPRRWWKKPENIIGIIGVILALLAAIFSYIQITPILFPSDDVHDNATHIDSTEIIVSPSPSNQPVYEPTLNATATIHPREETENTQPARSKTITPTPHSTPEITEESSQE